MHRSGQRTLSLRSMESSNTKRISGVSRRLISLPMCFRAYLQRQKSCPEPMAVRQLCTQNLHRCQHASCLYSRQLPDANV